jgi:hypothetical protein
MFGIRRVVMSLTTETSTTKMHAQTAVGIMARCAAQRFTVGLFEVAPALSVDAVLLPVVAVPFPVVEVLLPDVAVPFPLDAVTAPVLER